MSKEERVLVGVKMSVEDKKILQEISSLEARTLNNYILKILKDKVDEYKKSKEIGGTNE